MGLIGLHIRHLLFEFVCLKFEDIYSSNDRDLTVFIQVESPAGQHLPRIGLHKHILTVEADAAS